MPEFLSLISPAKARENFLKVVSEAIELKSEKISTVESVGRVAAKPIIAPYSLPTFNRSAMDGYAVRAEDTYGASESLPAFLKVVGEVKMGETASIEISNLEAMMIHTGGMLPQNANAVVMLEHTQRISPAEIEVYKSVSAWENTILQGEEILVGETVLAEGQRIRSVEMGGLLALGITQLEVFRKPRVGILSSGDEIVSPESELVAGKVRDVNTYTISALVRSCGGEPIPYGIIPDDELQLRQAVINLKSQSDLILISAGSSLSARDYTARVIQEQGLPGILVHGLNTRPGKPTILALCDQIPVIGLPGNPLSAYVIASHFVKPVIYTLEGMNSQPIPNIRMAKITVNLNSQAGREDWVPTKIIPSNERWLADPIFGKSNMIHALARADGLIWVPEDRTGISADETVTVELIET